MKTVVINDSKLQDSQIDRAKAKSRAVLIENNKILVGNYSGTLILPGGKIDNGETEIQAMMRELKEETGIIYKVQDLCKYMVLKHYQPNYPTRDGRIVNRLITNYYYFGRYKGIDLNEIQRSEREKKGNLKMELLEFKELKQYLNEPSNNPRKPFFDREIREALDVFRKLIRKPKMVEEQIEER